MWLNSTQGLAGPRKSVLVVEDDDEMRSTLEALLRSQGYDVATCSNGRDALTRLHGTATDVIVLDLMKPVMDSGQFRVEQKRDPELAGIPVVAVTADRSAKAGAIDADAFLVKPIDTNALLTTLDRIFLARERDVIRARLVEADRLASLGTLALGVAHEINNPLAYVIANVELVAQELDGRHGSNRAGPVGPADSVGAGSSSAVAESRRERMHDAIGQIREGLERVRMIVADLKAFSQPTTGGAVKIDVRRVLDSSANIVGPEFRHRARLVKSYGDVPLVSANEARLGQVFVNLIVNAAQSLREDRTATNEIRLATRRIGNGYAQIEISDTGAGIPADILGQIFEPFYTTKPLGVGTGLGLSICHGIVTALGGKLSVESELGRGSAFRVDLPPAREDAPTASRPAPPTPSLRRGRVLVVDDEQMICRTFDSLLGGEHEVTALTSARAACARIAAGERFDVILSDLMMPEMSGIELHDELARIAPDQAAKMVFLTGGAFSRAAREFTDRMPNTLIEKPFDWSALIELVRQRID